MHLFNWFAKPKSAPSVVLKNVLGEVLLEIPGRHDLIGANLAGLNLAHVDLSGMCLDGVDLEGANLFGARLVRTSLCRANLSNAELSFSNATGANFRDANLDGCEMYRSETRNACFDGAVISPSSDVPGIRVVAA
jgi:uncharacterized protein YjbI with pentapeptide repeats